MKLVIDLSSNTVAGRTSDPGFSPSSGQVLTDVPEGFDMERSTEWSFGPGGLTHDPLVALNRAKAARKALIKNEAANLITASDWKLQRAKERETAGWATLADVDAVLTERESIRRSSGAAELALEALTDVASVQSFTWAADVLVIAPRRLTHTQFVGLFTDAELQGILAAAQASPAMGAWWKKFELANGVDLNDRGAQGGLQALEFSGLIGEGRAAEILS